MLYSKLLRSLAMATNTHELEKTSIRVMVAGKVGAGKSSLLNYVFGTNFAAGGCKSEHVTKRVSKIETEKNGVRIEVIDTPGFQDNTDKTAEYIKQMAAECTDIDLFVFCISVLSTRSDQKESASALQVVTKAFGEAIWTNSIVALTFSNIALKRFTSRVKGYDEAEQTFRGWISLWENDFRSALIDAKIAEEVVRKIGVHPVGHSEQKNFLEHNDWISDTWAKFLEAARPPSQPLFILMELGNETFLSESDPEIVKYKEENMGPGYRRIILSNTVKESIKGAQHPKNWFAEFIAIIDMILNKEQIQSAVRIAKKLLQSVIFCKRPADK